MDDLALAALGGWLTLAVCCSRLMYFNPIHKLLAVNDSEPSLAKDNVRN